MLVPNVTVAGQSKMNVVHPLHPVTNDTPDTACPSFQCLPNVLCQHVNHDSHI